MAALGAISILLLLQISATQIYFSFPIKVHYCNDHSRFTCFLHFQSPFAHHYVALAAVLVTLIGRGSVDVRLRPKGLSNLRRLSTRNPV
jgi:hypothetical protein